MRLAALGAALLALPAMAAGTPTGLLAPRAAATDAAFLVDRWQLDEGLPQISVRSLVQDRDGYLWLATLEGLVRFDGSRFTVYDRRTTPEIASNFVRTVALDERDGSLWLATRSGLSRCRDGVFSYYGVAEGLSDLDLQTLYLDRRGRLWIGGQGGLQSFDGAAFTAYDVADGLAHPSVWAIVEDRDGALWIGTEGGLSRLADGRFTTFGRADGLASDQVQALHVDRAGVLWVGTFQGLSRRGADGRFHPADAVGRTSVLTFYEEREESASDGADSGVADGDGAAGGASVFWLGTEQGLVRLADGRATTFDRRDGLPDNQVRALLRDREGSLWVGTLYGGLARLRPRRLHPLGTPEGLVDDTVWTVLEGRGGEVWIGSNGGLTRLGTDGALTDYTVRDGLPGNVVRALAEDRAGTLWVGTTEGAARRVDGVFAPLVRADGTALPRVNRIYEDRAGRLWIATRGAGLHRFDGGRAGAVYTTADGLPSNVVRDFAETPDGTLWIATDSGVTRFADGRFAAFDPDGTLASDIVGTLYVDAAGTLWIGTWGGGLVSWRDGELRRFTVADGLFDDVVFTVLEDRRERLWMTSNKGLFYVEKAQLEAFAAGRAARLDCRVFSLYDGMRSRECNGGSHPAGWRARDGRLWLPTIRGVLIVDADRLERNPTPPPVVIEEALVDGRPYDPRARLVVPPGAKRFELRYTALTFLAPHRLRFEFRLEGFDDGWTEAGDRRVAYYTNLAPGSYTFRVRAANADGVWDETGAALALEVRPAFYQTPAFYAVCLLLAVLLARGLYRLRLRALLRHNRDLREMKVQLLAKNAEVEAKNEELERFTYTVSHDLKSPLITILGFLGMLEKDTAAGDRRRVEDDLRRIRGAALKMQRLLEELLELSRVGRRFNPPEEVAMYEVAQEAAELVAGRIAQHGAVVTIDPTLPTVVGDRARLLQVFQNLIDNAVKFSAIDASAVDVGGGPPQVEVGWRRGAAGEPVFFVRDHGVGVAPEHHEKVFGLFDKLDPKSEGTGVGLALVRRIVELHGGRIWIESQGGGRGATFCFTIPRGAER